MATRVSQFRTVAAALVEHRSVPRYPVTITRATVRKSGKEPVEASLCDLSIYGCRIESPATQGVGDHIWLRLNGGLPIAATVVWSDRGFAGCRFTEAIDRAVLRSLTLTDR